MKQKTENGFIIAILRLNVRGAKGIRTPDPLHAMEMRYQLRYSPKIGRPAETPRISKPPAHSQQLLRGARGIRTPDPLHAMEMRYQLRYSPASNVFSVLDLVYITTSLRLRQHSVCRAITCL